MKFVDVKNDIAFRKIFGNENKKEILLSFLNAVLALPIGKRLISLTYRNTFQLPENKELKSSILDLRVTDERGVSYIIEMQVEEPIGFDKRVQYYTAKEYSSQIDIGDEYPKLNQVIFIGILNFEFFKGKDYLTKHLIINKNTGKQELKDLEFNFIELPKFNLQEAELKTLIEKWTYFIKNAPNLDVIPSHVDDEGLKHAYEDADRHNWTKEELSAYNYVAMRKQDVIGATTLAVQRAVQKAVQIAEKQKDKIIEEKEKTIEEKDSVIEKERKKLEKEKLKNEALQKEIEKLKKK